MVVACGRHCYLTMRPVIRSSHSSWSAKSAYLWPTSVTGHMSQGHSDDGCSSCIFCFNLGVVLNKFSNQEMGIPDYGKTVRLCKVSRTHARQPVIGNIAAVKAVKLYIGNANSASDLRNWERLWRSRHWNAIRNHKSSFGCQYWGIFELLQESWNYLFYAWKIKTWLWLRALNKHLAP